MPPHPDPRPLRLAVAAATASRLRVATLCLRPAQWPSALDGTAHLFLPNRDRLGAKHGPGGATLHALPCRESPRRRSHVASPQFPSGGASAGVLEAADPNPGEPDSPPFFCPHTEAAIGSREMTGDSAQWSKLAVLRKTADTILQHPQDRPDAAKIDVGLLHAQFREAALIARELLDENAHVKSQLDKLRQEIVGLEQKLKACLNEKEKRSLEAYAREQELDECLKKYQLMGQALTGCTTASSKALALLQAQVYKN